MDVATARMRLETMLRELDRSITLLKGTADVTGERAASDVGAELVQAEHTQAMLDAATRQRNAVLAALKRIDEGIYGRCVDCGKLVPEGRLEARPEADRCVQCQSKLERRR